MLLCNHDSHASFRMAFTSLSALLILFIYNSEIADLYLVSVRLLEGSDTGAVYLPKNKPAWQQSIKYPVQKFILGFLIPGCSVRYTHLWSLIFERKQQSPAGEDDWSACSASLGSLLWDRLWLECSLTLTVVLSYVFPIINLRFIIIFTLSSESLL